jgi:hypothetical protein
MSSTRILRDRLAGSIAAMDRAGGTDEEGGPTILAQTATLETYPTSPSSFFACRPILVDGHEVEGGAASFTVDPARIVFAFNLGTAVPPSGTMIIVNGCGGRWVFRYDG